MTGTHLPIVTEKNHCAISKLDTIMKPSGKKLTPYNEYKNFVTSHCEAAAEYIPTKTRGLWRVLWSQMQLETNETTRKKNPY